MLHANLQQLLPYAQCFCSYLSLMLSLHLPASVFFFVCALSICILHLVTSLLEHRCRHARHRHTHTHQRYDSMIAEAVATVATCTAMHCDAPTEKSVISFIFQILSVFFFVLSPYLIRGNQKCNYANALLFVILSVVGVVFVARVRVRDIFILNGAIISSKTGSQHF